MLLVLSPLLWYAHNQQWFHRHESAWMKELKVLMSSTFGEAANEDAVDDIPHPAVGEHIASAMEEICEALRLDQVSNVGSGMWGMSRYMWHYCCTRRDVKRIWNTMGLTQLGKKLVEYTIWYCRLNKL